MTRDNARWFRMVLLIATGSCLLLALEAQQGGDRDAAALIEKGRFEQAIPVLESILARSPNDLKARNLLGIAFSRVGRHEAANDQFRKAVDIDPHSVPSLKNLARSELAMAEIAFAKGS